MTLWLLRLRNDEAIYDHVSGFVVRAPDEAEARRLAGLRCGDEGPLAWTESETSTCEPLTSEGSAEVILVSRYAI